MTLTFSSITGKWSTDCAKLSDGTKLTLLWPVNFAVLAMAARMELCLCFGVIRSISDPFFDLCSTVPFRNDVYECALFGSSRNGVLYSSIWRSLGCSSCSLYFLVVDPVSSLIFLTVETSWIRSASGEVNMFGLPTVPMKLEAAMLFLDTLSVDDFFSKLSDGGILVVLRVALFESVGSEPL